MYSDVVLTFYTSPIEVCRLTSICWYNFISFIASYTTQVVLQFYKKTKECRRLFFVQPLIFTQKVKQLYSPYFDQIRNHVYMWHFNLFNSLFMFNTK